MKTKFTFIFLIAVSFVLAQQTSIPRIDKMPNLPSPYSMRNWKKVAIDYNNFIFDLSKTGTYLPITKINTSSGTNYYDVNNILMDTYVGQQDHGNVAECINILPAIVGASLVGVDQTKHLNINWVSKVKDFFNLKNGQNVYLNNYSISTGGDWWYEIMPNIYFYQLYSLYPNADNDFEKQFSILANRELDVLYKLGANIYPWIYPSMNYRAFNLITGLPFYESTPEPEAAGSIAWIMYQAYCQTKHAKYLQGAELALDFLQNWISNPSYEIQLPYGIVTAARMNAIEGTNYNIDEFMNWTFSSGQNTLRGWGCIVGNWNGYEVSGLIGEANDRGEDYAFSMNGFQHAAALAPVAKYDKRYARAIAKWILNMANASRLFYWNALPQANQESASYNWAKQYDLNACIPYESMKQNWNGTNPCAMGDAVKSNWASTNLSMYSGSSVGYLASIIDTCNVKGILQIDLNKTDFRGDNVYPNYLYYNPTNSSQNVEITLPIGNYDIYDAISETTLKTNVNGKTIFSIEPDFVRLLVIYPTGKTPIIRGRLKTIDSKVIDYHANGSYVNRIRVKSFSASDTIVKILNTISIYCLTQNNVTSNPSYEWFQNNVKINTTASEVLQWKAPETAGYYKIICKVLDNNDTATSTTLSIKVVEKSSISPVISDINFPIKMPFEINTNIKLSANVNTYDVQYSWSCNSGIIGDTNTSAPLWKLPSTPGIYSISLKAKNDYGQVEFTKSVLVKDFAITEEPTPLIYYPLNGDTKNYAQSSFNAVSINATSTTGVNGISNGAYQFISSANYLYTPNETALNFNDKIAISFWVKPDALATYEQFIVSHGSWEERYKISITPEKKLRWTLKTDKAVVDVDADSVLKVGEFQHFTAVYTGYSLELYCNGLLSGFKPLTGNIKTTDKSLTIARKEETISDYSFKGIVDEFRIYNNYISTQLIQKLPKTFTLKSGINNKFSYSDISIYPNPFSENFTIKMPSNIELSKVEIFDLLGKCVFQSSETNKTIKLNVSDGVYFIKISTTSGNVYTTKIIKQR